MKQAGVQLVRPRARLRGVSLVEVVAVVAILGIIGALASPRYAHASINFRLKNAAHRLVNDFDYVRQVAVAQSKSYTITFVGTRFTSDAPDLRSGGAGTTYAVDYSDEPYLVTGLSAGFGGDAVVVLDMYGAADDGGLVQLNIGTSIVGIALVADTGLAKVN